MSVNQLFQKLADQLSPSAVDRYKPQLTVETANALLQKNHQLTDQQRDELTTFIKDDGVWPTTQADKLTVGGMLNFGLISLDALAGNHLAQGLISISAVLNPGKGIYVAMSPWTINNDPATAFQTVLHVNSNSLRPSSTNIPSTNTPLLFYRNETDVVQSNLSAALLNVTMSIEPPAAPIQAAAYQSTITWTISDPVATRMK